MIILDTNVLSEFTKQVPDGRVHAWADELDHNQMATTAVSVAEQLAGIAQLPAGRRRNVLAAAVQRSREELVGDRVLPFDLAAARHYAEITAARRAAGRPILVPDAQIAAICRAHRATLATHNIKGFDGTGVEAIDPWQA